MNNCEFWMRLQRHTGMASRLMPSALAAQVGDYPHKWPLQPADSKGYGGTFLIFAAIRRARTSFVRIVPVCTANLRNVAPIKGKR